jgi:hypothetical protein
LNQLDRRVVMAVGTSLPAIELSVAERALGWLEWRTKSDAGSIRHMPCEALNGAARHPRSG